MSSDHQQLIAQPHDEKLAREAIDLAAPSRLGDAVGAEAAREGVTGWSQLTAVTLAF